MTVWVTFQDLEDLNNNMKGTYSYSNRHRMHKFMSYEKLEEKVIQWAKDRDIFENSNAIKQIHKIEKNFMKLLQL